MVTWRHRHVLVTSLFLSLSHRQKVFFLFFFKVLLIRKLETEHVFIEREVDDDRKKTKEFLLFFFSNNWNHQWLRNQNTYECLIDWIDAKGDRESEREKIFVATNIWLEFCRDHRRKKKKMRLIFKKKTFSKVLSNKWKVSVLFVYTTERIPIAVGYSNTQRQSLKKKFFCRCVSLMIYSISLLRRQFYNACKRYRSMLGEKKNWFDSLRRKITRLKGINLKRNLLTSDWIRAYFLIAIWYLIQEKMICIYCCWIRFGNLWFICKSFLWDDCSEYSIRYLFVEFCRKK